MDPNPTKKSIPQSGEAKKTTVETSKIEWGPDFDEMYFADIKAKIDQLNASLASGEKPWRLPTSGELVTEFRRTSSNFEGSGFRDINYWSSNRENTDGSVPTLGHHYCVSMNSRQTRSLNDKGKCCVRFVRDAS